MNLLFSFDDLGTKKDKATTTAKRYFERAGATVVDAKVDEKTQRTAGITFRRIHFTYADGQTISFGIKQTGDIYQIKLNGKDLAIKEQDDHVAAIGEMVKAMDVGRTKFQRALTRVRVQMPTGLKSTVTSKKAALVEKVAGLTEAITAAREQLAEIQAA